MSIWCGDVFIKTAIELGLKDIKENPWLIEDIFSDFIENPLLNQKYGMKEVDKAKSFIANNKIHIFMAHRIDSEEFPCVTIAVGNSDEDKSLATLGDLDIDSQEYTSEQIGKPIPWIVKPFDIVGYDQSNGEVILPKLNEFKYINEGMILVNANNGDGYIINSKKGTNKIYIDEGVELDGTRFGISPKYTTYMAKRERIISQESYSIGCHVHGDTSNLLFLFPIVKYALLRYRESLLEAQNFQLSGIKCSDIIKNNSFETDNVFSRFITLYGQVEESWVKTPYGHIEAMDLYDPIEQVTGINIISNEETIDFTEESENDLWKTVRKT